MSLYQDMWGHPNFTHEELVMRSTTQEMNIDVIREFILAWD